MNSFSHPRQILKQSPHASRGSRDTRQSLLEAATRLFAQRGFDGTSVREIAEAAGVNLAMVSYHFSGKEGLYTACIEPYGKSELEAAKRHLSPATPDTTLEDFKTKLRDFCVEISDLRMSQPEVSLIVARECDGGVLNTEKLFRETFLQTVGLLQQYFESGRRMKILRTEVEPLHAAGLLFGAVHQILRSAPLAVKFHQKDLGDRRFRVQLLENWIDMLWSGISSHTQRSKPRHSSKPVRKRARS